MPFALFAAAAVLLAAACGDSRPSAAAGAPAPVEVGVIELVAGPVTLTRELPGRTSAFRVAEVRARVDGIVQKRLFTEGAEVKEGQPLFSIDPAPYRAALASAQAQVARAEASIEAAKGLVARYGELLEARAVSRQENDDAVAKLRTAQADLAAGKAAVAAARIRLGYTDVRAPIAGRIGRAEVTEGAYVQAGAATLLATVQQLDPLYVDLTWSSAEVLRMRRRIERGELRADATGAAQVTIVLEDGSDLPDKGALQFTDVSVDPTTGSVALRAIVPNRDRGLLPGMFVRARIEEGVDPDGLLVPQRAVTRDQSGRPVALVVDAASKVERRLLTADREVGDAWLVTDGLRAGERVIVEGLQKAKPGAQVRPVPYQAPARPATPAAPATQATPAKPAPGR